MKHEIEIHLGFQISNKKCNFDNIHGETTAVIDSGALSTKNIMY